MVLLNGPLPDCPLYLLDTFKGFAPIDIQREVQSGFSASEVGYFQYTSVALVMSRMTAPSDVHIRKGFPPKAQ